jgi:hypothetical protein
MPQSCLQGVSVSRLCSGAGILPVVQLLDAASLLEPAKGALPEVSGIGGCGQYEAAQDDRRGGGYLFGGTVQPAFAG